MKKAFLFLTMLLFAFMGTMRADEVTVCDGTVTNGYIPVYGYYADTQGCQSEFVIPASEIGILPGGQISKLTFYLSTPATSAWTATFQVYMTEIEGTTLSAFVGPSGCTQVYQGALNGTGSTMEVVFDNNYTYNGGNLLIGTFVSTAGDYKSAYFYGVTAAGASIQRNSSGASTSQRNFLPKTTFEFVQGDLPATTIVPSENPVQLGVRPIGAWMKPYELAITNQGTPTTVTGVDGTANFAVEAEVPYALGYNGTMPISVTTTGTPAAGTLNGQVLVSYSDRTFTTIDATAEMYEPVDGDVWEMAEEVTAMPFQGNAPTGIYRNYELGQADDAADAVYKVTFDNDVLFSAGTNGAGAKTRLYTEDFNGVGGPDADNNYVYNGPTVNPGPMQMWFAYAYSGTNTWYGLSAGGGYYYGYQIPASYIEELGLAGTSITTVEAAARESYDYECYIIKGGATPFDGELVSFGVAENPQALYFFDINLEEPVLVNEGEDIWVIFYSDSPYASYCGRIPVDATNGKIWTYNPNATSPAWSSNTAYTPVIYTRFLELPTGREVTVDLGTMTVKSNPNAVESEIAAVDGTAMGVSKAQMYNEAKAQNTRGNRDTQTLIEEGWEDGIGDWTMNNCESGTGVYTGAANNGSNCFRFKWTTNTPQYLISPELTDNNGGTMSFYCRAYTYTESYRIGYSTTTDDISAFTFGDEVTVTSQLYAEHTATFPAGTKYVAIASTAYDAYYFLVDDITITADVTSGGGSTDPVYQIADMYVPAGTYYVAVASKTENFQVDMMTTEVPAPEQAVVVSPYDGETNVSDPYLAEWILGDYTTEMQVLFGTQYPPQTALIDWTDYLVESAFLMDLEPNQSYFLQVNERNVAGTTEGEIIAFTTPIDPVEGLEIAESNLYPGDAAVFTWDAARTFKSYNLYRDGVKVNETPITTNTYTVEGLEYNMNGYEFAVTNVFDAGESAYSNIVTVYMTGFGSVEGYVYDTDTLHPIAGATIMAIGVDEHDNTQTFELTTDENGFYEGDILAGMYDIGIVTEGYENEGKAITVNYNQLTEVADIFTHEFYYPLEQITATEQDNNEVLVEWSWTPAELIVDFETGDFSQANFTLPATYPWAITTGHSHEGTYAIKSTCEGVASGLSEVEVTVDVPYDGKMGFWVAVSSEANYDKFHFYIDGVEKGAAISGVAAYAYKEFDVTEGTHTYKWAYQKDSSVNSNDDCAYVDDITLYRYEAPLPPVVGATTYDFEDGTMQGWTTIDANNDGYDWVMGSQIGGIYLVSGASLAGSGHESSNDMVCSGSFSNATSAAITPDNYLVSPQISAENGAQIQFWACAQDASYPAEHFGVAVSTTTATASAFTMVQEWTMTAKSDVAAEVNSEVRGTRAQGAWYQYAVDLSAYAGQDIYVAIRHFNCNDQFILNVDDITLATGGSKLAPRGDRSLANYILHRRNLYDSTETVIANNLASDVMSYTDNSIETFGVYQWGIQAKYEGYAPTPDATRSEVINEGFESGSMPEGWTQEGNGTWSVGTGDYSSTTGAATGSYNAKINHSTTGAATYLITPAMDLSGATEGTISCNYINRSWAGDTDGFGVYYRVNGGAWNELFSTTTSHSTWTSTGDIALTGFAANYQIGFKQVDNYGYGVGLDDVVVTTNGSAPGPQPTPGDGLSEIIWSNIIEKDMDATLTFNVTTDNGQAPVGATIAITGDNTYNVAIDETGHATKVIRKGNYTMEATLAGYTTTWSFDGEITADATYDIAFVETIAPVANLYVSPTGWVMWETEGGVTPGPGPQPGPGSNSFTEGFEGGLNGWNVLTVNTDGGEWIYSDNNLGGYDYTELAHGGTGFAMCYSYVDYVGAFDTDSYLYTPQKYAIENGSTLTFWADNANDTYPENFSVCVATADNPTAADFTQVWSGGAKGTGNGGAAVRHQNNRYENWRSHNIDLSAYAGQEVYIAFHDVNEDMYEIWIDDVELSASKGDRTALLYKITLDGSYVGETTEPFFQHNVEGMAEGSTHTTGVRPIYVNGMGDWMYYTWTYTSCDHFAGVTNLAAAAQGADVKLTWTMPGTPGPGPGPQPGTGWTEGFENGLPTGWSVVDGNNDGWTWCLTSAIPSTWTYYATMTLDWYRTGSNAICSGSYINGVGALTPNEYLVMGQQTINNGTTFSFWAAATDASYPADHFGVAVSDNGTDWTMVQEWTLTAKEGAANGGRESRDGNGAKLGTWYQYTVDLSAHAGNKYLAIRHFNCTDQYIMCVDDLEFTPGSKGNDRDMWDLVGSFTGTSAGQQAVATDGNYIYTASWQSAPTGGHTFYQYTMDGTFVEGFEIAGATGIRDLTTDGEYFYGTSGGAQIFILDFTTRTLVGTINCSGLTSRHISYDPERDGFWSGNWSTLALYSRTGALIQNGPAPTSAYGSAYYKDSDNVEHLFLFCQPNSDCKVYDYNITTGTLGSDVVLDYSATAPGCTGIAGGCFIGEYNGNTCWYGNSQQDPNLIAIFELEAGTPGPQPHVEGILGAMVFANGEYLTFLEGNASEYVVANAAAFDAEFGVRVVYDGAMDTTYYAMSCMETVEYTGGGTSCDPVTNLTAVAYEYQGNNGALVSFTEPAGATAYKIYVDGQLLGSLAAQPVFINFEGSDPGIYQIGVVAVYATCESDMATVDFNWGASVDENEVVNAIYPNPTSGDLHINAMAMTHVTVFNAMGQMVYNQDVNGDEMIINMGQFEAGVYMVRIDTENGSSVKRITVVK